MSDTKQLDRLREFAMTLRSAGWVHAVDIEWAIAEIERLQHAAQQPSSPLSVNALRVVLQEELTKHFNHESLTRERDNWMESAAQFSRNADYYRDLVVRIGNALGVEAYMADDGSKSDSVLCAKVPELVEKKMRELTRLRMTFKVNASSLYGRFAESSASRFPTAQHARHQIHMDTLAISRLGEGVAPITDADMDELQCRIISLSKASAAYHNFYKSKD